VCRIFDSDGYSQYPQNSQKEKSSKKEKFTATTNFVLDKNKPGASTRPEQMGSFA